LKYFNDFDVVVHKALGNEPMVVLPKINTSFTESEVLVRRAVQGRDGTHFRDDVFYSDELETPVEALEREAELFKLLQAKKEELSGGGKLIGMPGGRPLN
jgi:hypothetical protein